MYMIVEVITNIFLFAFILLICVWGGWLYTAKQAVQVDPSPARFQGYPVRLRSLYRRHHPVLRGL